MTLRKAHGGHRFPVAAENVFAYARIESAYIYITGEPLQLTVFFYRRKGSLRRLSPFLALSGVQSSLHGLDDGKGLMDQPNHVKTLSA